VFELDENGTYLGIWTGNDTLLAKPNLLSVKHAPAHLPGSSRRRTR